MPTRIFSDGWETNDFTKWSGTVGAPATESTVVHHGRYGMSAVAGNYVNNKCYKTITAQANIYQAFYFQIATVPAVGDYMCIGDLTNSGTILARILLRRPVDITYLSARNHHTATVYNYDWSAIQPNTWYRLQLHCYVHATAGELHLWLDGTPVISQTGLDTGVTNINEVNGGIHSNTISVPNKTCYYDCFDSADYYIADDIFSTPMNLTTQMRLRSVGVPH